MFTFCKQVPSRKKNKLAFFVRRVSVDKESHDNIKEDRDCKHDSLWGSIGSGFSAIKEKNRKINSH
jgi:hypothetical protein